MEPQTRAVAYKHAPIRMVELSAALPWKQANQFHGFISVDLPAALENQAWKLADPPLFPFTVPLRTWVGPTRRRDRSREPRKSLLCYGARVAFFGARCGRRSWPPWWC